MTQPPCRDGKHNWAKNGTCQRCGWTRRRVVTAPKRALLDALEAAEARLARARFVADYWRKAALNDPETSLIAHPLCMVLAALDGETDPAQCGIGDDGAGEFDALRTEGGA